MTPTPLILELFLVVQHLSKSREAILHRTGMADAASGQGNESDGFQYQGEKPGSRYRVEAYVCNRGLKDGLRSDA